MDRCSRCGYMWTAHAMALSNDPYQSPIDVCPTSVFTTGSTAACTCGHPSLDHADSTGICWRCDCAAFTSVTPPTLP